MVKLMNKKTYHLSLVTYCFRRGREGFSLVELLIVIAILGTLATLVVTVGTSSQMKSRDARRKSDINNLAKAMELFYNDYGIYPPESSGRISACDYDSGAGTGTACSWGTGRFEDDQGSIYFKAVPEDPLDDQSYLYRVSPTKNAFRLFASLENPNDPDIIAGISESCGSGVTCNFAITSGNTGAAGAW
jgi:prepilin-type N-terminal cleavage/methylation domain-containing protein